MPRGAHARRCVATHSKYNRMPQFLVMLGLCFVLLFWGALPARAVTYDETLDYVARLQALATQYCAESDTADDPVLLTLTYTRTGEYSSTVWEMTAGIHDTEFDNYVLAHDPDLEVLKYIVSLTMPNGEEIDFGHLMASVNLTYCGLPTAGGWGGDCMQLARAYNGQASDAAGYAELMRATFNMQDDGTNSVFGDQDLRADLDSVIIGTQLTADTDIAETLRQYYDTLTDYDRAKQFIMLSFGTVNTSDAAFKDRVYNALLQDSGAQLLLYLNGMWQLDGWQLDPAWAPAMRGATDLLAEYLTTAVNGEKVASDNSQSLVAMGGQALAEALNVLGESDAAEAVLAAEGDAASATPAPDSDTASAVIDSATDALRAHFNVKVFQVILLILGAVAVFVLIFSVVLLVNHNQPNRRRRR